jgi:hypothetical protein
LLFVHGRSDVWILYAVTVFYGAAGTFAGSARSALMTVILPRELLGEANGIFQTVREGLRLIAPLVGAAIYSASGGGVVALLDSASFVAVVVSLLMLRTPEPTFEREEHHFLAEALAGARHIVRTSALAQIIFTCGVCLLVVGFSETVIFAVIDQGLHRQPSFFGVLSSLQGVGAIAGGISAPWALRRLGDAKLVGLGMGLFAIGDFSFISGNLPLVLVGIAVAGAGVAWLIVGFATAIQTRTPDRLQGRVFSAADMVISTPQTVSIALGAVLITAVDYRVLVVVEAVVTLLCGVYLVTRRIEAAVTARSASAPSPLPPQPSALPAPDPPEIGTTAEPARDRAASDQR